jgi:hypothetical protein
MRTKQEFQPLLVTREQAGRLLGCSPSSIIRLEREEGLLEPIRLRRSPNARVMYRRADIEKLIEER